jgi:hypothetical protein
MNRARTCAATLPLLWLLVVPPSSTLFADSITIRAAADVTEEITKGGRGRDVSWGDKTDPNPLIEIVPPAGTAQGHLVFNWTKGDGQTHTGYTTYDATNATNLPLEVRLFRPKDKTITDWKQTVTNGDGSSEVRAGNLKQGSPWSLQPLDDIADAFYRIPDLAPTQGGGTIYAAVNFDLYLQDNPEGFLDGGWTIGQTLRDLGLVIANGQIPGLAGILWATSEFAFDPNAAIGWSPVGGAATLLNSSDFQAANGDIVILAAHQTAPVPEPLTVTMLAAGGITWLASKRRRRG